MKNKWSDAVASFCLQQLLPPCCRYSILEQCQVVKHACKLLCVEFYTSRNSRAAIIILGVGIFIFRGLTRSPFTLNIPPTWRRGFMFSSMTPLLLVYTDRVKMLVHSYCKYRFQLIIGNLIIFNNFR